MVEYYYRKDSGNLWRKTSDPTEQEQRHLAGAPGLVPWGLVVVDHAKADHVDAGHCLCIDGRVDLIPEEQWPENREVTNDLS